MTMLTPILVVLHLLLGSNDELVQDTQIDGPTL